jgi:prolyl-tRNA editing enzyme YbaK/EbsC (Cys-tRNA(Pro) deacylase)
MDANYTGQPKAGSYSVRSLNELLYDSLRLNCPDNVWWENFEPTIRSITRHALKSAAPDNDGKGIRLPGEKSLLLYAEPMKHFINHGVTEFLDAARHRGYRTDVRLHRPSHSKTDIGYSPKEVAITLAYARDGSATNFLIFTRNHPDKIDAHIPRAVLKKITGVKDITAAARQAERNLAGRMKSGAMGPFGLIDSDNVYIDSSSYMDSYHNPPLLVNFSTGFDMLSFDMRLVDARDIIERLYGCKPLIEDLWTPGSEPVDFKKPGDKFSVYMSPGPTRTL